MNFIEDHPQGVLLHIRVQPRASRSEIAELRERDVRVRLQSPPLDNRANEELITLLAKLFDCPKSSLQVVAGAKSRNKTVKITDISREELQRILREQHSPSHEL